MDPASIAMSDWYEVYDNEEVQLRTRRRVSRIIIGVVIGIVFLLSTIPIIMSVEAVPAAVVGLSVLLIVGVLAIASRELLRLRRVVWCLKLSVHRVVGYDYARRKTVLPWVEVERIDVNPGGLMIVGRPAKGRSGPMIQIPIAFPDYAQLSHRVVEYAEAHGVPVCVDGRPWQLLDLSTLYPFMADQPVMERRGGSLPGHDDPTY